MKSGKGQSGREGVRYQEACFSRGHIQSTCEQNICYQTQCLRHTCFWNMCLWNRCLTLLSVGTRVFGVEQAVSSPQLDSMPMASGAVAVRDWLAGLDFDALSPHDALRMAQLLAEVVGAAQAALGRCGLRLEQTAAHKEVGAKRRRGVLGSHWWHLSSRGSRPS